MRFKSIILLIIFTMTVFVSCSQNKTNESEFDSYSARINVNIADLKSKPEKFAERVTQALFNEIVDVIDTTRRYDQVKLSDGYIGWIRNIYLDDDTSLISGDQYIVDIFLAPALKSPKQNAERHAMFPYGCSLYGEIDGDYLKMESSRYGVVFVNKNDVISKSNYITDLKPDSSSICDEAGKFIGSPYLWGGKSFFGIDCSGLTQIVLRKFDVDLLRDSKDQRTQGIEVTREDIQAGDLLFFPKHVGLAVTNDLMIHSTGGTGGVAYTSLNPDSPIYSKYFDESFETARRVIK